MNLFYDFTKIELLIAYLIIGLIIGLYAIKDEYIGGSKATRNWTKLMNKLDHRPPTYQILFIVMIGWPIRFFRKITKKLKE